MPLFSPGADPSWHCAPFHLQRWYAGKLSRSRSVRSTSWAYDVTQCISGWKFQCHCVPSSSSVSLSDTSSLWLCTAVVIASSVSLLHDKVAILVSEAFKCVVLSNNVLFHQVWPYIILVNGFVNIVAHRFRILAAVLRTNKALAKHFTMVDGFICQYDIVTMSMSLRRFSLISSFRWMLISTLSHMHLL